MTHRSFSIASTEAPQTHWRLQGCPSQLPVARNLWKCQVSKQNMTMRRVSHHCTLMWNIMHHLTYLDQEFHDTLVHSTHISWIINNKGYCHRSYTYTSPHEKFLQGFLLLFLACWKQRSAAAGSRGQPCHWEVDARHGISKHRREQKKHHRINDALLLKVKKSQEET